MSSSAESFDNRNIKAMEACQASIRWFAKTKRMSKRLYVASQLSTIILSTLTTVLILVGTLPKWAQALPAALAAIYASLSTVFQWKDNWIDSPQTSNIC